jgi:hypothetical protein
MTDLQSLKQRVERAEIVAWESRTEVYRRYITDAEYQRLRPSFQAWYRPYRCSHCPAPSLQRNRA